MDTNGDHISKRMQTVLLFCEKVPITEFCVRAFHVWVVDRNQFFPSLRSNAAPCFRPAIILDSPGRTAISSLFGWSLTTVNSITDRFCFWPCCSAVSLLMLEREDVMPFEIEMKKTCRIRKECVKESMKILFWNNRGDVDWDGGEILNLIVLKKDERMPERLYYFSFQFEISKMVHYAQIEMASSTTKHGAL